MKITPDDPALTAFVLGELGEKEAALIERNLKDDEALREEKDSISSLAGLLTRSLGPASLSLGEQRIAEIHKAGQRPDSEVIVLDHRKRSRRQSLMVVAGVAAVVVTGFVALSRLSGEPGGVKVVEGGGNAGGVAEDVTPAGSSGDLPGEVRTSAAGGVAVPLGVPKGDPAFVERALHATGELPSRDRFQIADWINITGGSAEPQLKLGQVGAYTELGPCSWNPEHSLLIVNLRSLNGKEISPQAQLVFNPERVKSARLVGGAGKVEGAELTQGVIKSSQTLCYEIELLQAEGQLGTLNVKTAGDEAGYLPISGLLRKGDDLSADYRTAVALGNFARWASSEARDKETLVSLAREARELLALAEVTHESSRYALDMILQSEEKRKKE